MKKLFSLIALAAFSAANAQDATNVSQGSNGYTDKTSNKAFIWSIGIEPSIPLGKFKDYSGFGFGGSLQGEYKPGERVGITVNAGYIDYFGKTVNNIKYADFKYWPVMGGLKLYLSNKFYAHGQAGPGFGTNGLGTSFWYGGGLGCMGKHIDLELKYVGWKQEIITKTSGTGTGGYNSGSGGNTGGYNGSTGGSTGGTGGNTGGGSYGGHYPTIGIRLAYNF